MGTDGTRPAELGVTGRQERRFRFLQRLYETTDGNTNSLVDIAELAGPLGLNLEEASNVAAYLANEGLIQGTDWIVVTHAGVVEVEAALSKPTEPTTHFRANIADILQGAPPAAGEVIAVAPVTVDPVAVAPIAIEPIAVAPIEVAAVAVAPVAPAPVAVATVAVAPGVEHASHADMRVILDFITAELDQLGLTGDARRQVVADITSARAHLASASRRRAFCRRSSAHCTTWSREPSAAGRRHAPLGPQFLPSSVRWPVSASNLLTGVGIDTELGAFEAAEAAFAVRS
jgi:hypothetical protein